VWMTVCTSLLCRVCNRIRNVAGTGVKGKKKKYVFHLKMIDFAFCVRTGDEREGKWGGWKRE